MSDNFNHEACAVFQERLPELIGSGTHIPSHPHVQTCANCRALLSDLQAIVDAVHDMFPPVAPREEVWRHIQFEIDQDRALSSLN